MQKNRKPLIIACSITAILVFWMLSGLVFRTGKHDATKTKDADKNALFHVRAVESTAELIARESVVNARTEANREVTLRADVGGRVQEIGADRGSRVKNGEKIAILELRDREARVAQAEATFSQRTMEFDSAKKLEARGMQSKAELASAQSGYESARAELTLAKLDLERATIAAPFDGVLVERYVEKGASLSVGDDVALVADLDPIVVKGYMTEKEMPGVHVGNEASATLATGEKLSGKITFISPDADSQTRMYRVEMRAENKNYAIRSGVTAEMRVPHDKVKAHFVSPAYVLLSDAGDIGLLLADADGTTHFSPIEIVKTSPSGLWVTGIPEKTIIVTVGKDFVNPGQKVGLVMETKAAPTK